MIDTSFDFSTDAYGEDADSYGPWLRRYHRLLWWKPLQRDARSDLVGTTRGACLHHRGKELLRGERAGAAAGRSMSRALLVGALLVTIWSHRVDAQRIAPTARDNAAYIELAGAGGLYSLNVERRRSPTLLGRFGGTYYDITDMDQTRRAVSAVLAGGTYLIDVSTLLRQGPGRFLELGGVAVAGRFTHAAYGSTKASGPFSAAVPFAGLRYELPGGGLLLRVTAQQVLPLSGNKRTDAGKAAWAGTWAGFSFGYAF